MAPAPTGHRENCPGGEWRRYAGQAVCFPLVSFGSNQLNPLMGTLKTTEQWTIILYGDWPCVFGLSLYKYNFFCLQPSLYLLVSWAWWDWPLTWLTNHCLSVLWHCWLGHVTRKTVTERTYNVSSGTLNSNIPYHTVDGWVVTFGTTRRGLGGLRPRPVPSSLYRMSQPTRDPSTVSVPTS